LKFSNLRLGSIWISIFLVLIVSSFSSPLFLGPLSSPAAAQPESPSKCQPQIDHAAAAQSALDRIHAVPLAKDDSGVTALSASYVVTYDSIFDNWKFDSSCNVTLESVNVVFQLKDSRGAEGIAIAKEDPTFSAVENVTLQQHNPRAITNSTNWSGYDFWAPSEAAVYESLADWTIPAVSQPYTGACNTTNPPGGPDCALAVWPGLTNDESGLDGIAQTGTMSTYYTNFSGSGNTYYLWYEFYPQQSSLVNCLQTGVHSGDSISAYVLNLGYNGGSTSSWNLAVTDNTISQSCTVTGYSFTLTNGATPRYGNFIAETPLEGSTYATVPSFSAFNWGGSIYYGGSANGIYTPYSNSAYANFQIQRTCTGTTYTEVYPGTVSSSNLFAVNYNTNTC
jgi:hypothetical protein